MGGVEEGRSGGGCVFGADAVFVEVAYRLWVPVPEAAEHLF